MIIVALILLGTSLPAIAQKPINPEIPIDGWPAADDLPVSPIIPARGSPISYRSTDWEQLIDQTWGPSPLTIPQMLSVFDSFWSTIDLQFACFQDLNVDWSGLRDHYRPQVEAGVSRGRFAAIMNHLARALEESHTEINDLVVCTTPPAPGVPLLYCGGWGDNAHFRAGLTPLPDSTLLVYQVRSPHPLGLVPGDIILGYEGIPWKELYPELIAAELPIHTRFWQGSAPSSKTHSWLMSAGMNWHLFSTIDVVKYSTGDTLHLSVAPLMGPPGLPFDCTEQLPVPGVPMPVGADNVSWGLIEGTAIGYIYVESWTGNAGTEFTNAVDSLMTDIQTTGLIIDFRTNFGGNMFLAYPALELLFNEEVFTIGFKTRCGDHLDMCPSGSGHPNSYVIHGDPETFYNRPIAVLVGPGAVSSGDQVANLLKFHPHTRFFGKSTATTFNGPTAHFVPFPSWSSRYASADAYLVSDPTNYLTHDEFQVDDPVWLTPDDVAEGRDSVVEAAVQWINSTMGIAASPAGSTPRVLLQNTPNPFVSETTIGFQLSDRGQALLRVYDPAGRLVRTLLAAEKPAGDHHLVWDRTDDHGRNLPAGVYFYQLDADGRREAKKMVAMDR